MTKPLTYQHLVDERAREIARDENISHTDARQRAIAEIYTLRAGDRVATTSGTLDYDGTVVQPDAGWVGTEVPLVGVEFDNAEMIGADPQPSIVRRDRLRLLPGQRP